MSEGYISNCRVIASAEVPAYENISVPVLVLAGREDKSAPLEGCEKMFEMAGTEKDRKRLVVLEGVGHWCVLEVSCYTLVTLEQSANVETCRRQMKLRKVL